MYIFRLACIILMCGSLRASQRKPQPCGIPYLPFIGYLYDNNDKFATQTDPVSVPLSGSVDSKSSTQQAFKSYSVETPSFPWTKPKYLRRVSDGIDPVKEIIPAPEKSNIGKKPPSYSLCALRSMGFVFAPKNSFKSGEIVLALIDDNHIWWPSGIVGRVVEKHEWEDKDNDEYSVDFGVGYHAIVKSAIIGKYPLDRALLPKPKSKEEAESSSLKCTFHGDDDATEVMES